MALSPGEETDLLQYIGIGVQSSPLHKDVCDSSETALFYPT